MTLLYYFQALEEGLFTLADRWNLVFLDFDYKQTFPQFLLYESISLITLDEAVCCSLLEIPNCVCPIKFLTQKQFLIYTLKVLINVIDTLNSEDKLLESVTCNSTKNDEETLSRFKEILASSIDRDSNIEETNGCLRLKIIGSVDVIEHEDISRIGTFSDDSGFVLENGKQIKPIRTFYRVGVTHVSYQVICIIYSILLFYNLPPYC